MQVSLNSIGFDWDVASTDWDKMYQRLVAYREKDHNSGSDTTTRPPFGYDVRYNHDPESGYIIKSNITSSRGWQQNERTC